MEYKQLGGLRVPVLSLGTATFGGGTPFFKSWGETQLEEAKRMVHLCMDAGINFFDTADIYSYGLSEEILGKALEGKREQVLISTKATFKFGNGPNDYGSSRHHLIKSCEASLRRLKTDYIDVYHLHAFDGNTPIEETLSTLDHLIKSGKARYIACSNFSGWHLMKSLSISERYGWARYVAHQAHYSLLSREFEWELMPLGIDQHVATMVWSPLSLGRLSGKYHRKDPLPSNSRIARGGDMGPALPEAFFYNVIDTLREIASEISKTPSQVAFNWLLNRPTVANIIIGCRNEEQLKENLGCIGWTLSEQHIKQLDAISERDRIYPYWHQMRSAPELNSQLRF